MITLKQIAEEVNLSVHSVSDVINCGDQRYNKETARRIREAAGRLGYRPNRSAQVLSRGKSGMIGLFHMESLLQPNMERTHYISNAVREAGYRLNVETITGEGDCDSICDFFIAARMEGVIAGAMTSGFTSEHVRRFREAGIPVVALAPFYFPSVPTIVIDRRRAFRELTRHLLATGCRRLTYCGPWRSSGMDHGVTVQKTDGFTEEIEAAGGRVFVSDSENAWIEPESGILGEIFPENSGSISFDPFAQGRIAMSKILRRDRLPDAILWSNDDWAVGALSVCHAEGVRVPRDVAMVGFDNTSLGANAIPPLTSMAQPTELMSRTAVELLLRRVRGEKLSENEMLIELPCRLVVRQSCGSETPSGKESGTRDKAAKTEKN